MAKGFGENLALLLEEKRITQKELARSIGVSAKTVQEWVGKDGRIPRNPDHLRLLAEFFGVTLHYLLFRSEDPLANPWRQLETIQLHAGHYEVIIRRLKSD